MFTVGFKKSANAFDHNNQGLEFRMSDFGNPMIGPGGMGPSGDETYQPIEPSVKGYMKKKKSLKEMGRAAMQKFYKLSSDMNDGGLSSGGGGLDIAPTTVDQLKWTSSNGPDLEAEADDRQEQRNRRKALLKSRKK